MMNIVLQQHHVHIASKSLLQKQMIPAADRNSMEYHMAPEENRPYHPPPQTYASCFGLPYQDHNYGAPPPPTPPASPSPPPPPQPRANGHIDIEDISATAEIETTEPIHVPVPEESEIGGIYTPDDSITRCICDFLHDDGYMICCDKCSVWQHVDCMGLDRNSIPDTYLCEKCEPRKVDKQRAVELQLRKRAEIAALDTSSTETEDETKGMSTFGLGRKAKNRKKEKKLKGSLGNKKNRKGKKEKEEKKERKKREKPTTPQPNRRKSQQNPVVKRTPTKSPRSPKAKTTIQPVRSPVHPVKSPNQPVRSPIQTVKSPVQPVRSPIQVVKSPVQPVKSPVHAPKSPLSPVKSPVQTVKNASPVHEIAVVAEETNDAWIGSDNGDGYEVAKYNHYSVDVENLMASKKFNGQHWDSSDIQPSQLQAQLCEVVPMDKNKKGLEANEDLISSQILIEFKGKVMLREQYDKENMFFKQVHPFVLFYSGFESLDICIDASTYGNDARYVRRSCTPNAEVQHVVENGRVHFYVYSSKGISKGAEITIPFDFNYQECNYGVECACSKASCPVARYYSRKEEKLSRKKRAAKSTSLVDSKQVVEEVKLNSPVRQGTKRRRVTPLKLLTTTNKQGPVLECTSPPSKVAVPALVQSPPPVPDSPIMPIPPTKLEVASSPGTTIQHQITSQQSVESTLSMGEYDEHDHKKMTREERKMEAIMKAFEKLEKREERRKEALARLETTKRTPRERDKDLKEASPKEEKSEEKKTEPKSETPKPKKGKKKKHATPARRRSRFNSGASGASSTMEALSSADESCSATPNLPMSASSVATSADSSAATTPSTASANKAFRFPKTKKHLMNEWLHEKGQDLQKPLTIKTDQLETMPTEDTKEFVMQVHSPHSFSHLRRGSVGSSNVAVKAASTAAAVVQAASSDSSIGSAKKRWLRQAMYESTSSGPSQSPSGALSPVHNGPISPGLNCCANSPGSSPPIDFVTPLKKRRLARESVSMDSPFPPTPSTPTPGSLIDLSPGQCDTTKLGGEGEGLLVTAEDTSKLTIPNGYKSLHYSPVTPLTPNDNLFERFGSPHRPGLAGSVDKQGSLDSSVSESLLSPSQDFSSSSITFEEDTSSTLTREAHPSSLVKQEPQPSVVDRELPLSSIVKQDPTKSEHVVVKKEPLESFKEENALASVEKTEFVSKRAELGLLSHVDHKDFSVSSVLKQEATDKSHEISEADGFCNNEPMSCEHRVKTEVEANVSKDDVSEGTETVTLSNESKGIPLNSTTLAKQKETVPKCQRFKLEHSLQPVPEETKEDIKQESKDIVESKALNLSCKYKLPCDTAGERFLENESHCASTSSNHGVDSCDTRSSERIDDTPEAEAVATSEENGRSSPTKTEYDDSEDVDVCSSNVDECGAVGVGMAHPSGFAVASTASTRNCDLEDGDIVEAQSSREEPDDGADTEDSATMPSSSCAADCSREHGQQADQSRRDLSEETVSCSTDQPEHSVGDESLFRKTEDNGVDSCADKMPCVASQGIGDAESAEISSSEHHMAEDVLSSSREEGEISDSETTGSTSFNSVDSSMECSTASSGSGQQASQSGITCQVESCLPSPCNRHGDSMEVDSTSSQIQNRSPKLDSQGGEGSGLSEMVSSSSTPLGWECEAGLASTSSGVRTDFCAPHSAQLETEWEDMDIEPSGSSALSSVGCLAESTTSFCGGDSILPSQSSQQPSSSLFNASCSGKLSVSSSSMSAISSSSNLGGSHAGHGSTPSSSINFTLNTPLKKKVSLLEYRKRMKERRLESCSSQSSQGSVDGGNTCKTPTSRNLVTPPTKDFPPTLAPLPLFESAGSSRDSDKCSKDMPSSPSGRVDGKDLGDVRWNNNATTVERIREQAAAPLSLTERLRREFGVDASESEEEDEKKEPESSTVSPGPMYAPGMHGQLGMALGPGIGDRVGVPPPPPGGLALGLHAPSPTPPPPPLPPPHAGPPPPGGILPLMSLHSYPTKTFTANVLNNGPSSSSGVSGNTYPQPGTSSSSAGSHLYSQTPSHGTPQNFPQPVPQSAPPPPPSGTPQTSQFTGRPAGAAPDSGHQAGYQFPTQGQGLLPHPVSQPQSQPQPSQQMAPQFAGYGAMAPSSSGQQQYPPFSGTGVGQPAQQFGNYSAQSSQQNQQQGFPTAHPINYNNHGYSSLKKNNFHSQ